MSKITKEEFDKLYSEDITKKEYESILAKIDNRLFYIGKYVNSKLYWIDYANGEKGIDGFFDPIEYEEYVIFTGEFDLIPSTFTDRYSFPTRWLWEDFETEFKLESERYKQRKIEEKARKKKNNKILKEKKTKIKAQIESKLSPEELKYFSFK